MSSGNKSANSALKNTPFDEELVLAFKAFNPYISPKPDYLPFIATTGVLFLETNHITQPYFHNHSFNDVWQSDNS